MLETVMIHHVTSKKKASIGPLSDYAISPSQLESYLHARSEWKAVSAKNGLNSVRKGRHYLLTFDDGYRNNLTDALPVLEQHDTPCILFITSGFVEGDAYPYELELAEVIEQVDHLSMPSGAEEVNLNEAEDRGALYESLRLPLRSKDHKRRQEFMERLAYENGYNRSEMQNEPILNWKEVRHLSDHPLVTIGAHTNYHLLLTSQSLGKVYDEMMKSKRLLEKETGNEVRHFSYPYGGQSFMARYVARWIGFKYAYTTRKARTSSVSLCNRYSLPRISIESTLKA